MAVDKTLLTNMAALTVGVNRYDDQQFQGLLCAENDCFNLSAFLTYKGLYDPVVPLIGPDSRTVFETARQLTRQLKPGGLFLFFFAGHGYQIRSQQLLLCPGAEHSALEYMQETIPVDLLAQRTERAGVNRVFVLDTCRTSLLRNRGQAHELMQEERTLRNIAAATAGSPSPLTILCSCSTGRASAEIPRANHGLFTAALLESLTEASNSSREVLLADSFEADLNQRIVRLANQHGLDSDQLVWIQRSGPPPTILRGSAATAPGPSSQKDPSSSPDTFAAESKESPAISASPGENRRERWTSSIIPEQSPHRAAWTGDVAALKLWTRTAGTECSVRDSSGMTPLHSAVAGDQYATANVLLERGADVDATDSKGATPLHAAARTSGPKLVTLLLRHGAEVNAQDNAGRTPLHYATQRGTNALSIVEAMIESGADLSLKDDRGFTVLHEAAWSGNARITELLLMRGAIPEMPDNEGATPLHLAASCGETGAARALLENGADHSTTNQYGETALHVAAASGHIDMVECLLRFRASINAEDQAGQTPLARARWERHQQVVLMLRQHGGVE